MSRNTSCTVYIGNLDEKVNDRVLYEILIQVGRIVDLHIPRDKETSRPKGYAFAEYETEEIANYAVRLFSGLVRLYNKTLKFAISGQDKLSQNSLTSVAPKLNSPIPLAQSLNHRASEIPQESTPSMPNCRTSAYPNSGLSSFPQASPSPNGFLNKGLISSNFEYSRRMFGSMLNTVNR